MTLTFRDALDIHLNGTTSLSRLIFDEFFSNNTMYTKPGYYTPNELTFLPAIFETDRYEKALKEYYAVRGGGECLSHHLWVYTYPSFIAFIRDGIRSGYFNFTLEYSIAPEENSFDFYVVLKKSELLKNDYNARLKEIIKLQVLIDSCDNMHTQNHEELKKFCERADQIYIYGTGYTGAISALLLECLGIKSDGFVVSDDFEKDDYLFDKPVYHLSDDFDKTNCGLLLTMNKPQRVIPNLIERKLRYFEMFRIDD